ncbi:hypothetical protein ACFRCQ_25520 [Cytobacillus firmus]|uniref:hypothetical protein n=1 Tax=Cytobacillus firmus TaxID=1399 RepID=UPI0036B6A55B
MKYLMTGIEHQLDRGFGINADAFRRAADQLNDLDEYNQQFSPQKHMPVFYLYRHSIELYFKSMIFLFHLELNLPYSEGSEKPQIYSSEGKWRDMDNCHWVDALYWYWSKLIRDNKESLSRVAPEGDWRVHPDLKGFIDKIVKYDRDSTFFRYPYSKNQQNKDEEKYSMRKVDDIQDVFKQASSGKGGFTLLIKDEEDNIKAVYSHDENILKGLLDVFREASSILHSYHIMTRMTLCDGY